MARGRRAPAEILEMSPTEHKVGGGEDERRIWSLRLRVHPDDGPAFEARAEHGFRLSPDFEETIESGLTVNMLPESGEELEVAYDPDDPDHVIVRPREVGDRSGEESNAGRGGPQGIRLRGIVGGPIVQWADDNLPPPSRP
jgi:hypothetical protein